MTNKDIKMMARRTGKTEASLSLFFNELVKRFNKDLPYERND